MHHILHNPNVMCTASNDVEGKSLLIIIKRQKKLWLKNVQFSLTNDGTYLLHQHSILWLVLSV